MEWYIQILCILDLLYILIIVWKILKILLIALNILFTLLIIYNLILAIFVQSSYMYIGYQGSQKVFVGTFESRNGISMVMIPAIAFILIRSEYIYWKSKKQRYSSMFYGINNYSFIKE